SALSPHDLYLATLRPGSPEILTELRAREGRSHNFDDRMELLRQERQADPPLPAAELNRRMAEALSTSFSEHPSRGGMARTADGMLIPVMVADPEFQAQEMRFVQSLYSLSDSDRTDVISHLRPPDLRERIGTMSAAYTRAMDQPVARSGERDGSALPVADRASTYVQEDRSAAGRTVSDVETAERRGPARESGERTRSEVQEAP